MFRRPVSGLAIRGGLTLLELVVVMAILVALAGLLIPLMPGLFSKASTAAGATNLDEINKAVQLYATQHNDLYPNNLDSIVLTSGNLASYVPPGLSGPWFSQGNSTTLSADLSSLSIAGISKVVEMIEKPDAVGDWNPTYFPYGDNADTAPSPVAISHLAYVDPTVAAGLFAVPSDGRYVMLGLGKYSAISGEGMVQAPVFFSATGTQDPDHVYARYGLVFQTAGAGGKALTTAKYLGSVAFDYYSLKNGDQMIYQNQMVNK
jgi:type II secretory pathway pseudopilin PulG